jgi:probable F420-dependent oxidoreductase
LLTKATALDDLAIRHLIMEFGASIFFTDYSITPAELGVALEERGFDSLWAAEHSHIPVPRRTPPPGGGELAKRYYDVMDPFVTLAVAAAVTRTLKVGTGVCLVIQRDTIQTAKLVASIDQVSGGRFLFGIGGGWNAEEIEAHGTVFATRMKKMREQIEAMKEIWTKSTAEYSGEIVKVPAMQTWPKPVQKPNPPILLGGAFPWAARRAIRYGDGWYPNASSGNPEEYMPRFRQMATEAGRDPASLPVTIGGAPEDVGQLRRFQDLGATRVNVSLPAEGRDAILPILDRWAKLVGALRS